MGKNSKEEEWRREGMAYAYKICLEHGYDVPALKEELQWRQITKAPLAITKGRVNAYSDEVRQNCVYTFKLATLLTLHDEFDMGKKRLDRFWDRFLLKIECLNGDYATWDDFAQTLEEECKLLVEKPASFVSLESK